MPRRYVNQLADGESVEEAYLVSDKQVRANRNGNAYLLVELRDRTGTISGRLWNVGETAARAFEPGDFLFVRGKVQLFQGALQLILNSFDRLPPEQVDLAEFLPHTEHDIGKLLDKLRAGLRKLGNPHLRGLVEAFWIDDDFVRDFCRCPAGVRMHHAYIGGLLEHVVALLELVERVAPLYPEIDKDLLLIGAFLHDVGKVRELSTRRSFVYTDEGQLIGHLVIGVEMLNEKVSQVPDLTGEPFPEELLLRLKHMILSHHGTLEFGSPKVPMTPEAIALHHLDNLDAKIHIFTREIRDDRTESAWTAFNPNTQRRLFKGGPGGDMGDGD